MNNKFSNSWEIEESPIKKIFSSKNDTTQFFFFFFEREKILIPSSITLELFFMSSTITLGQNTIKFSKILSPKLSKRIVF